MPSVISPTLAINQLSKKLENDGRKVYKFGFGQSPFPVPTIFEEGIKKYASEKDYLPASGLPELQEAISHYYQFKYKTKYDADRIVIGPGSKMLLFLMRLCTEGYTILPSPSWVSYAPQAYSLLRKVHWLHTSGDQGWLPDPSDLNAFCNKNSDQQHLLILNYPSNPTGAIPTEEFLKEITQVCRKHNVIIISDEIYKDFCFEEDYVSISKFYPEGTIICDGISKWAGAGGHRLGYAIFPEEQTELMNYVISLGSETYSCVSNPIQRAAVDLFLNHKEASKYQDRSKIVLKHIASYTQKRLVDMNIKTNKSSGAFYLFPSFDHYRSKLNKKSIQTSDELFSTLLNEAGVALLSGTSFGRKADSLEARFSYVDFDGKYALDYMDHLNEMKAEEWLKKYTPKIIGGLDSLESWLGKIAH